MPADLRGSRGRPQRRSRLGLTVVALCASLLWTLVPIGAWNGGPVVLAESSPPLVLAYYYIWYTPGSWARAKRDLPLLGSYSSSDPLVIAQHVTWAKQAGIDGFIVSWKHEPRLDGPLKTLVEEARRQHFKLVLLYESLDVRRLPIGASRVAADLKWFEATYGADPVFDAFGTPAVIWSGSWKYTPADIATVRSAVRAPGQILLLGSEKSAADYTARQHLFDGDAYYWSSADPLTTAGYAKRLDDLRRAVRSSGGRWIAPAAPGFDARMIGGTSEVSRRDGDTYRASWTTAMTGNPSAVGIISWNEFSENSHIEPSTGNRFAYLTLTAELIGKPGAGPVIQTLPSPVVDIASGGTDSSGLSRDVSRSEQLLSSLVSIGLLGLLVLHALRVRRRLAQQVTR